MYTITYMCCIPIMNKLHTIWTSAADARDIMSIAATLNLEGSGLVFMVVSDNDDVEMQEGGSHW